MDFYSPRTDKQQDRTGEWKQTLQERCPIFSFIGVRGGVSVCKVFAAEARGPEFGSRKAGVVAHTSHPSTGEEEAGISIGLADQPD